MSITAEDFHWTAADGLRLAGCVWHPPVEVPGAVPLICLPGLSRNTRDFADVGQALAANGRKVYALDYRGRGRSGWDQNWTNYSLPVEASDIALFLAQAALPRFAVLGTSRGGLHAMMMAAQIPREIFCAAILNDVGPRIELGALLEIRDSFAARRVYASFEDVAATLKSALARDFLKIDDAGWLKFARQAGRATQEGVIFDHDPALDKPMEAITADTPWPELWPLFAPLLDRPVLVLRGANSRLLTQETLQEMAATHPDLSSLTIPDEGHAPLLWDSLSQRAIEDFLRARVDG
ncbi:alpha/beta fold hydrolase [Pannonibacter indicus]|uniref:Pimeloyl-ACP methyl ester carboxylesterase n=1 Tax=Pannonibacter indicus TaxID=466044 RepID=A0A0K6HYG4_9HYPH|nr:alpha/beta hydrolase [Pannonibacter indicus]CUA96067.1 Pimeloyl-ACP methyl ester carboxylesterase [Pannonibacter indicus]